MVATLILVRDDRGNLHDLEGHLRNAAGKEAARRRFRSRKSDEFRRITLVSIDAKPRTSIDRGHPKSIDVLSWTSLDNTSESTASCKSVRIMTHEKFAAKHPHPPSLVYVNIDPHSDPTIDRHQETIIDRQPYEHLLQKPPETVMTPSDDGVDPLEVDRVPMGRTLWKRKEKVAKHLKRGANEKKKESFRKRVFRIPLDKPFNEAYYTQRLWVFFRETRETEENIRRMFCEAREKMRMRITLKKKSGTFAGTVHFCGLFPEKLRRNSELELFSITWEISTDTPKDESIDSSQGEWENDYYVPTMATHTMHTKEYDEDYEEERAIEQRANLDEEDRLLHHSSWKKKSP
ncbi:hypothetical protein F2Q69_00006648 [Brassica cretica]|uniref:Uncharacterized protein n=1 Tax=Brassica cretica TaxID=69181 RepID=A0A8S9PJ55_BRACR|nr:hypothetical protein F2Q69_00006648 [Brassica cretica]